jgi:stearoyl-CoA desaturase (delta-9 desaturase)
MPVTQPVTVRTALLVVYESLPTVLTHLALIAIPFLSPDPMSWVLFGAVALVCGFGITIGHHRYFSHRAFKTSRWFQFALAWAGCVAAQRGPLWWAAHHRQHHAHSDTDGDVHSPETEGFFHAHIGWLFRSSAVRPDFRTVRDFAKYPELVWLDHFWKLPVILTAVACYLLGGWAGVVFGYCLGSVVVKQVTFSVNSFGHLFGPRPYDTGDGSRNNWVLGILALGDGWHNNHHHSPRTARHGFKWYEFDPSYYLILVLERVGVVWGVKKTPRPPKERRGDESRGSLEVDQISPPYAASAM